MKTMDLTRRDILKAASVLALFVAAPKLRGARAQRLPPFANIPFDPSETRTIAIVGAGVAGLAAAYVAAKAGFRVVVYESDGRYGGRSLTVRPADRDYRAWWFARYNPKELFPAMYVSAYQERPDSPAPQLQTADFSTERWPDTGEYVELFLNAGPGRIPSNHKVLLDLCGEIGARLEPYIFLSDTNLLASRAYNNFQPVQWREINYSLMGDLAQILYKAVQDGAILQGYDRAKVESLLTAFGDLDSNHRFQGSSTVGYLQEPGGWLRPWSVNRPVGLAEILGSGFIGGGDAEQSTGSFLFNPNHVLWQPTLMQPVGGMDRIWQQLLVQPIAAQALDYPAGSNIAAPDLSRPTDKRAVGETFVGDLVKLNAKVTSINNLDGGGVQIRVAGQPDPINADFCIVTVAPALLSGNISAPTGISQAAAVADPEILDKQRDYTRIPFPADMRIDSNLPDAFKTSLGLVNMTPAVKVGFQGRDRFWEQDNQIYGGISWTTMLSSQIWYPSEDFNAPTGILTGAYNRGAQGYYYATLGQDARIAEAIAGGETLHSGYAEKVYAGAGMTIAWQYMPGQIAGWAAETYNSQCRVYLDVINLPQGSIYFAGDTYSETPGWQEGAADSARLAVTAIVRNARSTDPALYGTSAILSCD